MAEHWNWTTDETGMDDDTPCPHCGEDACEASCTGAILAREEDVSERIFVCLRCFAVSEDPAVYRHPLHELAGHEAETGEPLCQGCVDAVREAPHNAAP